MAFNLDRDFVNPDGLNFEEWASRIYYLFPNSTITPPPKVHKWRQWAVYLMLDPRFENAPAPTEKDYPKEKDWIKWATFLINYLDT